MRKHFSFSQILPFYSKQIFLARPAGPETQHENISPREIQQLNQRLNKLTAGFNNINERNLQNVTKELVRNNLRDMVINEMKKKLNPSNPEQAQALFDTMYTQDQINNYVNQAQAQVNRINFNISRENVDNVKFGSRILFVKNFKEACDIKSQADQDEISMDAGSADRDLASKVASQTTPDKLRTAASNATEMAKQAVTVTTQNEGSIKRQIQTQIRSIVENVTRA